METYDSLFFPDRVSANATPHSSIRGTLFLNAQAGTKYTSHAICNLEISRLCWIADTKPFTL